MFIDVVVCLEVVVVCQRNRAKVSSYKVVKGAPTLESQLISAREIFKRKLEIKCIAVFPKLENVLMATNIFNIKKNIHIYTLSLLILS